MNCLKKSPHIVFFAIVFSVMFFAGSVSAANVSNYVNFNVDSSYDASARSKVSATLIKTTSSFYVYVETNWRDLQSPIKQSEILGNLDALSSEFESKIYPTLTSIYGSESMPGIDGDNKITILFESLNSNISGYMRSQDGYSKLQAPDSNEREMLYLPVSQTISADLKVFLAHEFVHLIIFNQKDIMRGVQEEVWLNEAMADYASTILGYDDAYEGSNLQRRVSDFLYRPDDSLTEWQNTKYDYAVDSLFIRYLVDHYGLSILTDALHSKSIGIASLNEALLKNGAKKDFAQIFTDWTISIIINNCLFDQAYCYTNKSLDHLKINPTLIFLPLTGSSSLSMTNTTKNWSGNWQKIIGGNGNLTLEFSSLSGLRFQVPYIIYDSNGNYAVKFLALDNQSKGKITIKDFGTQHNALIMIPSLQAKISGFEGPEPAYPYTFNISIAGDVLEENSVLIQSLLDQINSLKQQIAALQSNTPMCAGLDINLYIGMVNNTRVRCLQQFLITQGAGIYPEALVTGNFGALTHSAVARFQNKYKYEILTPLGLLQGTGFVGALTRQKINQLL